MKRIILKDYDIIKFSSFNTAKLIVCGKQLMFNNPKFFNDPFDCDINLLEFDINNASEEVKNEISQLQKLMKRDIPKNLLQEAYEASQKEKIGRSSICCFSMRYDVPTMWSHYADNHNGIGLVFDYGVDHPFEHIPKEKITSIPVDYDNYTKFNYCLSKMDGIKKLFGTKSWEWKYESEYRLILLEDSGLKKFNKLFMTGVIFGLRVEEIRIKEFIAFCKDQGYQNLRFSRMKKEGLNFNIEEITAV